MPPPTPKKHPKQPLAILAILTVPSVALMMAIVAGGVAIRPKDENLRSKTEDLTPKTDVVRPNTEAEDLRPKTEDLRHTTEDVRPERNAFEQLHVDFMCLLFVFKSHFAVTTFVPAAAYM